MTGYKMNCIWIQKDTKKMTTLKTFTTACPQATDAGSDI